MSFTPDKIEQYNRERLAKVLPLLAEKCRQVIELAWSDGYILLVTQSLRTFDEQDALFRQRPKVTGARGGQSNHNYGLAVDFGFIINGQISWDEKLYRRIGGWAKQCGLEWGGNWRFTDLPHVQLTNGYGWKDFLRIYKAKGIGEVWNVVMTPKIHANALFSTPENDFEECSMDIAKFYFPGEEIKGTLETTFDTTETKVIPNPEPVGFRAKVGKLFGAITGGTFSLAMLKEWLQISISPETLAMLKLLLPIILVIFGAAVLVWFVSEKITNWKLTKLQAEINSDKSRHDIVISE
jgi:D-alanyl-D-alanine carboxypeptidase